MSDERADEELAATAGTFAEAHPDIWDAYSDLGKACSEAGPLDDETRRLVKLALAIGAASERASIRPGEFRPVTAAWGRPDRISGC